MKKIAFMFAAAALFVACGNKAEEVKLTADDSANITKAVTEELNQKAKTAAEAVTLETIKDQLAEGVDTAALLKDAQDKAAAAINNEAAIKAAVEKALADTLAARQAAANPEANKEGEAEKK